MQQTILGVLALMIVGSYTLSQHQSVARTYNELVDDEMEIAASGVAMHVMEIIGNRAFDERTLPQKINLSGMLGSAAELTSSTAFGNVTGCDLDEPFRDAIQCLDIDDVAMPEGIWQAVPFRLKDGKELPFDVHVDVYYVDPSNLDLPRPLGQTSLHKKVVVKIRSDRHVQQNRYRDGFVRLERIFSYDVKRAENRFKDQFGNPLDDLLGDLPILGDDDDGEDEVGGDEYDDDEQVEDDPNAEVWICHRSVKKGKIKWADKQVKQKFVSKHIGHGDYAGKCK